jgi:hypothetical protein
MCLKMGVTKNGWFIRENLIKMDDLGIPPFMDTPIWMCLKMDLPKLPFSCGMMKVNLPTCPRACVRVNIQVEFKPLCAGQESQMIRFSGAYFRRILDKRRKFWRYCSNSLHAGEFHKVPVLEGLSQPFLGGLEGLYH